MPIMDSLECARNIRDYQRTGKMKSNIPIIAASANARPEQIQMALEAGMVSLNINLQRNKFVNFQALTFSTGWFYHKAIQKSRVESKIDSFAAWTRAQG